MDIEVCSCTKPRSCAHHMLTITDSVLHQIGVTRSPSIYVHRIFQWKCKDYLFCFDPVPVTVNLSMSQCLIFDSYLVTFHLFSNLLIISLGDTKVANI